MILIFLTLIDHEQYKTNITEYFTAKPVYLYTLYNADCSVTVSIDVYIVRKISTKPLIRLTVIRLITE